MKRIVKITITLLISVSVIAFLFVLVAIYLKNNQTQILLKQLRNTLNADISIENIEVSAFKHFPDIDISFHNIKISSAKSFRRIAKDTIDSKNLLIAEEVDISFDILRLLKNEASIKGINIMNGKISLIINKFGDKNYLVFNKNSSNDSLGINIDKIVLKEVNLLFFNEKDTLYSKIHLIKTKLNGEIMNKNFDVYIQSNSIRIFNKRTNHIIYKPFNIEFEVNKNLNKYFLKNASFSIVKNKFQFFGEFDEINESFNLNMITNRMNLNVLKNYIGNFKIDKNIYGKISIRANFSGILRNFKTYKMNSTFDIENLSATLKNNSIEALNGSVDIKYFKGFNIKSNLITCSYNNSDLILKEILYSSINDSIKAKINLSIKSENLSKFLQILNIKFITGKIDLESNLNTTVTKISNDIFKECNIVLNNMNFYYSKINVSNLNGEIKTLNNNCYLDNIKCYINNSKTNFTGTIHNFSSSLNDSSGRYFIDGKLKSNKIDIDTIVSSFFSTGTGQNNLKLKLNTFVDTVFLNKSVFHYFKSEFNYSQNVLSFKDINTNLLKGKLIDSDLKLIFRGDTLITFSNFTYNQIDIKQFLNAVDNFGQKEFKSENISGRTSGSGNLKLVWINNKIINRLTCLNLNFELNNGIIENYKPLYKLSSLIDIKELTTIKFEKIKNNITIENNVIKIPQVDIKSSAINLTLAGEHSFNGNFKYHFKVLLSEILSKKFKKENNNKSEFGPVESDTLHRVSMYFKYYGDSLNSKMEYDSKKAYNTFSLNFKKQNSNFVNIIKNEFKNRKDTTSFDSQELKKEEIESEFSKKPDRKKQKKSSHTIEWKDE